MSGKEQSWPCVVLALVVGCGLGAPTAAAAEDPSASVSTEDAGEAEARAIAEEGFTLYAAQHYLQAAQVFQRAYDRYAEPTLLYNIARCHDKLGQAEEALSFYRRFLAIEAGEAEGNAADAKTDLRTRATERVAALGATLRTPPPSALPSRTPSPGSPSPAAARSFSSSSSSARARSGRLFWSGVALGVVGLAGIATGIALDEVTVGDNQTLVTTANEFDKRDARDQARSLGAGAAAAYTLGGLCLAGSVSLVYFGLRPGGFGLRPGGREPASRLSLAPLAGGGVAVLSGRF